jgi:hypothetical protein
MLTQTPCGARLVPGESVRSGTEPPGRCTADEPGDRVVRRDGRAAHAADIRDLPRDHGARNQERELPRAGQDAARLQGLRPDALPEPPAGQFTTQIGTAAIARIRIGPDGGFVGVATPKDQTTIRVRGRLVSAKLTGGRVELSVGTCSGSTSFRVRHA